MRLMYKRLNPVPAWSLKTFAPCIILSTHEMCFNELFLLQWLIVPWLCFVSRSIWIVIFSVPNITFFSTILSWFFSSFVAYIHFTSMPWGKPFPSLRVDLFVVPDCWLENFSRAMGKCSHQVKLEGLRKDVKKTRSSVVGAWHIQMKTENLSRIGLTEE